MESEGGARLNRTERISQALEDARCSAKVSEDLKAEAQTLLDNPAAPVPWKILHTLCTALRAESSGVSGPWLHDLVAGSTLSLPKPPPRERSEALEKRVHQLREKHAAREYAAMTADVRKREADANGRVPFSTYKDQLGFGVNVIVVMLVGYLIGDVAGSHLSPSPVIRLGCGVTGLVCAMIMETVLFIIRTSR